MAIEFQDPASNVDIITTGAQFNNSAHVLCSTSVGQNDQQASHFAISEWLAGTGSLIAAPGGWVIRDGAIQTSMYGVGSIDDAALAPMSVSSAALQDGAVKESNIADQAIGSTKYQTNSIRHDALMDGIVEQNNMANNSVGTDQVISGSLITQKYSDGSVTLPKLGPDVVGSLVQESATVPVSGSPAGVYLVKTGAGRGTYVSNGTGPPQLLAPFAQDGS